MKDKIIQRVCDKFKQRSDVGIKKYGTTLEENIIDDFLIHLQEELMDAVNYVEKLIHDKEMARISERKKAQNWTVTNEKPFWDTNITKLENL